MDQNAKAKEIETGVNFGTTFTGNSRYCLNGCSLVEMMQGSVPSRPLGHPTRSPS